MFEGNGSFLFSTEKRTNITLKYISQLVANQRLWVLMSMTHDELSRRSFSFCPWCFKSLVLCFLFPYALFLLKEQYGQSPRVWFRHQRYSILLLLAPSSSHATSLLRFSQRQYSGNFAIIFDRVRAHFISLKQGTIPWSITQGQIPLSERKGGYPQMPLSVLWQSSSRPTMTPLTRKPMRGSEKKKKLSWWRNTLCFACRCKLFSWWQS